MCGDVSQEVKCDADSGERLDSVISICCIFPSLLSVRFDFELSIHFVVEQTFCTSCDSFLLDSMELGRRDIAKTFMKLPESGKVIDFKGLSLGIQAET